MLLDVDEAEMALPFFHISFEEILGRILLVLPNCTNYVIEPEVVISVFEFTQHQDCHFPVRLPSCLNRTRACVEVFFHDLKPTPSRLLSHLKLNHKE